MDSKYFYENFQQVSLYRNIPVDFSYTCNTEANS